MLAIHNGLKRSLQALQRVNFPLFFHLLIPAVCGTAFNQSCIDTPISRRKKTFRTMTNIFIVPRKCYRVLSTLEDFEKVTKYNILHSFHMDFILTQVQKLRTKMNLLEK